MLSVSPASVTAATTDLIAAGYLREVAGTPGTDGARGRPPVALAVEPRAAFVAGIKFSTAAHTAVIHDFAGRPMAEITHKSDKLILTLAELLAETENLLDGALNAAGLERSDIAALGVGLAGFIDSVAGVVFGRRSWMYKICHCGASSASR